MLSYNGEFVADWILWGRWAAGYLETALAQMQAFTKVASPSDEQCEQMAEVRREREKSIVVL
jgi:hypothetical protein